MSAHPPVPVAPPQPPASNSSSPTLGEVAEEGLFYVDAIVVGATIMPGVLFCVPGLLFVIVPCLAIGVLAATVGLVLFVAVAPVRAGRRIARHLRHGVAARRAPRASTVPQRPQPVRPRADGLPADATMMSSAQPFAQDVSSRPAQRSRP
jgi:hypothetical protein